MRHLSEERMVVNSAKRERRHQNAFLKVREGDQVCGESPFGQKGTVFGGGRAVIFVTLKRWRDGVRIALHHGDLGPEPAWEIAPCITFVMDLKRT
jgi:hypothetical protein